VVVGLHGAFNMLADIILGVIVAVILFAAYLAIFELPKL
jgi:type II secretory pathway component PulF